MSVGDLVEYWPHHRGIKRVCLIIDIIIETTAASAGCKRYVVLTDTGEEELCWKGSLGVVK